MKTRQIIVFALFLMAKCLAFTQHNPYSNSDFSSLSPSRHLLYYTITDSINHEVKLSGFTWGDDTDTIYCDFWYVEVPNTVTHNGIVYTVTSVGEKWICGGSYSDLDIVIYLPTTVLSIEDSAFMGSNTPFFHSQQPPIIDSHSFVGCTYIGVPCGSDSIYNNAWGNFLGNAQIIEIMPYNVLCFYNMRAGNVSIGLQCNSSNHISLYAQTANNYVFSHWWDGNTNPSRYYDVEIHSDTSFMAYFAREERPTYSISDVTPTYYLYPSETPGSVEGQQYAPWGDTVTLTAHANHGYEFVGWRYPYEYDTTIVDSYNIGDSVVYYTWTTKVWRYFYSTDSTLTYATLLTDIYGNNPNAYHYATAEFRKKNYSMLLQSDNTNKGYVSYNVLYPYGYSVDSTGGIVVTYLTRIRINALAHSGYNFTHWSDGDTNDERIVVLTQDTLLTAFFEGFPVSVSITNETPEFGTAAGGGSYHYGDTISLYAQAAEHYHFYAWENNYQYYYDNPLFIVLTQDTSFSILFEIDRHHVEVIPNNIAYGSIYGSGDYEYGTAATISANPYSGYQFVRWSNGVTYNPYTFAVLDDTTLTAIFMEVGAVFNITATANDPTMGYVIGGSSYALGEEVILTAIPYEGYQFDHWSDNNTDNPRVVLVTSDSTFIAYLVPIQDIDDVQKENILIYTGNGCIIVEGADDESVKIFDMAGRYIGDCSQVLSAGVYIVRIGNHPARKIVVIR